MMGAWEARATCARAVFLRDLPRTLGITVRPLAVGAKPCAAVALAFLLRLLRTATGAVAVLAR